MKVTEQIGGARPEEISQALPSVFAALAHQDDEVKLLAAVAVADIGLRPDSAGLLNNYINGIGNLLNSPNDRLQGAAVLILGTLKPAPPPKVWPLLVTYLNRTDRNKRMQAAAVFYLARHPEKPEVLEAIRQFLSQALDAETRIGTLNAIGNSPRLQDAQIIHLVIGYLNDPESRVRLTALQTLTRLGQHALSEAEPALQSLVERTDEPGEVKASAKKTLRELAQRRVTDQLDRESAQDISKALPSIVVALASPDDQVKNDAADALNHIAARPDSAALLKNYINDIGNLLTLPDKRLQHMGAFMLGNLKPAPPAEIVPPLLAFLNRTDRDLEEQAGVVFYLARSASGDPKVADGIIRFLSRLLDVRTRLDALDGLAAAPIKNPSLIDSVIASLRDSNQAVRLAAVQTLTRMGKQALLQAEPTLKRVAENTDEPAEVKDAAKKALEEIGPRKK